MRFGAAVEEYYPILCAPIPAGRNGRRILAEEREQLTRLGIVCSKRHVVCRKDPQNGLLGCLLRPSGDHGYHLTGIVLQAKPVEVVTHVDPR